jgi:hypothetical protein
VYNPVRPPGLSWEDFGARIHCLYIKNVQKIKYWGPIAGVHMGIDRCPDFNTEVKMNRNYQFECGVLNGEVSS